MMLHQPKEFDRVAREWNIIYAGAPSNSVGAGSAGGTEAKGAHNLAQYVAYIRFQDEHQTVLFLTFQF